MSNNNLTPEQVEILVEILGKCEKTKMSAELGFYCPFHNKEEQSDPSAKKLSIHISGKWHCWHCHKRGKSNPLYIIRRFGSRVQLEKFKGAKSYLYDYNDEYSDCTQEQKVVLPTGYKPLMYKSIDPDFKACKDYLHRRGVTQKDIIFYKIGCYTTGRYKRRVIFLSFNDDGVLNYFVGRKIDDEVAGGKYMNSKTSKDIIFNELYVDWDEEIVLVEGPMDMIKCKNSIPLLGSSLSVDSVLFERIINESPKIVIALDREEDAWNKAKRIAHSLYEHEISVKMVDLRRGKYGDIGEMTKEVAERYVKDAIIYDPFTIELY